jgi:hypothetical protein
LVLAVYKLIRSISLRLRLLSYTILLRQILIELLASYLRIISVINAATLKSIRRRASRTAFRLLLTAFY